MSPRLPVFHDKGLPRHDDVIKWKYFPRYWPFVRGIHRWPVNSLHKGQWRGALMFSLICALNKRLSKQSWGGWFETPSCLLWRRRNNNEGLPSPICVISCWKVGKMQMKFYVSSIIRQRGNDPCLHVVKSYQHLRVWAINNDHMLGKIAPT